MRLNRSVHPEKGMIHPDDFSGLCCLLKAAKTLVLGVFPKAFRKRSGMQITDLKCALIGKNPVVRIVTDEGLSGYGEAEQY